MPSVHIASAAKQALSLFLTLLFLVAGHGVQAGSFGINPVKLVLSAQNPTEIMTVRNDGAQAAVMQVELASWTQEQGLDNHTPTRELLATPPIFNLPPGASQIIRIGLRRAPDGQREMAYRMFLQEVPPPPKPGALGLQVALRISVPVFIPPPFLAKPNLRWKAIRLDDHTLKIEVTNIGNVHDHLSAYTIHRKGSSAPYLSQQFFAYLLPGATRNWTLTPKTMPNPGETLRLSAHTDQGAVEADIKVDKP
jgi:fimbrial chaperone protein